MGGTAAGPTRHRRWPRASGLRRALQQVGRVAKTLYLLDYVDDETFRRRLATQLNRSESRHALARLLFFGHRGHLRRGYREGQEEQLGALGLLLNVVVLWNTRYIDRFLHHRDRQGSPNPPHLIAHLSPLVHAHLRVHGRYVFESPPDDFRPLRVS